MGRDAGFLAQNSAIAAGAEAAIIPEDQTDIDQLEKTKMDVKRFSKRYEAYQPFAFAALLALLLELLLRLTVLRRIP